MSITKVKIRTESLIENIGESGLTESSERADATALGTLEVKDGAFILKYAEKTKETEISSKITVTENAVTVSRRGDARYDFLFEEGKKTAALYSVMPYSFDAEITTKRIRNQLTEDGGELTLIYDLTIGGASKKTKMKIYVRKE